jgi:hypothetical protein
MKTLTILGMILAVVAPAFAQIAPALKPHSEQYDNMRRTLIASGEATLKPARTRYLAALAAAQNVATAAVKTGDIAAISAEISGASGDAVPAEYPPDLPRSLATERRNFTTALANVERSIPPKLRDLATRYLQTLAALEVQAQKTGNAALTTSIASEKQRVIPHLESAGGGQKNRNVVANADFSNGTPGEWPPAWRASENWKKANDLTLMQEGNDRFIRFRRLQADQQANLCPETEIAVPARARAVEFSARIRVKGLTPGKDYDYYPGIKVSARDAAGEKLSEEHADAKQDAGWKRLVGRCPIPDKARTIRITLGPFGAAGVIDFDDVNVEFK